MSSQSTVFDSWVLPETRMQPLWHLLVLTVSENTAWEGWKVVFGKSWMPQNCVPGWLWLSSLLSLLCWGNVVEIENFKGWGSSLLGVYRVFLVFSRGTDHFMFSYRTFLIISSRLRRREVCKIDRKGSKEGLINLFLTPLLLIFCISRENVQSIKAENHPSEIVQPNITFSQAQKLIGTYPGANW